MGRCHSGPEGAIRRQNASRRGPRVASSSARRLGFHDGSVGAENSPGPLRETSPKQLHLPRDADRGRRRTIKLGTGTSNLSAPRPRRGGGRHRADVRPSRERAASFFGLRPGAVAQTRRSPGFLIENRNQILRSHRRDPYHILGGRSEGPRTDIDFQGNASRSTHPRRNLAPRDPGRGYSTSPTKEASGPRS